MARYLDKFPKLLYTRDSKTTLVTNLLTRIATVKGVLDDISLFYYYDIQEGDTPEIIASKYYNDPELHWVILILNDIMDPYYDWPMTYQQFQAYITDKYGSQAAAQIQVHHYEKIVTSTDSFSGQSTKQTYTIDLDTYNSVIPESITKTFSNGISVTVETSKRVVDSYTFEEELNESKRKIKLIKSNLIPELKRQFEFLMSE